MPCRTAAASALRSGTVGPRSSDASIVQNGEWASPE
jgi:hypothetical protein